MAIRRRRHRRHRRHGRMPAGLARYWKEHRRSRRRRRRRHNPGLVLANPRRRRRRRRLVAPVAHRRHRRRRHHRIRGLYRRVRRRVRRYARRARRYVSHLRRRHARHSSGRSLFSKAGAIHAVKMGLSAMGGIIIARVSRRLYLDHLDAKVRGWLPADWQDTGSKVAQVLVMGIASWGASRALSRVGMLRRYIDPHWVMVGGMGESVRTGVAFILEKYHWSSYSAGQWGTGTSLDGLGRIHASAAGGGAFHGLEMADSFLGPGYNAGNGSGYFAGMGDLEEVDSFEGMGAYRSRSASAHPFVSSY